MDVGLGSYNNCRDHDPKTKHARVMRGPQEDVFPGLGLTILEYNFVVEYCGRANGNATRAAELAGCGGPNATRNSLQVTGSQMLKRPKVRKAVTMRWEELSAPSEEIIKRMTDDARIDVAPLLKIEKDGVYLNLTPENIEEYSGVIREIEVDPETKKVLRVKLNDAQGARRDLARIRRLYSDQPIVNVFNLQDLSNDELRKRLEIMRQKMAGPQTHRRNGTSG